MESDVAASFQNTVSVVDCNVAEEGPVEIVNVPGSTTQRMSMFQNASASGDNVKRTVRFSPGRSVTRWNPLSSSTGRGTELTSSRT